MTVYLYNEVALFHRIYFFLFIYSEQDIKNEVFLSAVLNTNKIANLMNSNNFVSIDWFKKSLLFFWIHKKVVQYSKFS